MLCQLKLKIPQSLCICTWGVESFDFSQNSQDQHVLAVWYINEKGWPCKNLGCMAMTNIIKNYQLQVELQQQ